MRLQFSAGPSLDETAINLSPVVGGVVSANAAASSSPTRGSKGGASANNRRRSVLGGGGGGGGGGDAEGGVAMQQMSAAAMLYLADVMTLTIGHEPLPVDGSDSVCLTLLVKGTERSIHGLGLSTAVASVGSHHHRSGSSIFAPTTISAVRGGGGGGPVEVVLYAPMSPSAEEWVVFLHAHLGDRVRISNDLL